MPLPAYLHAATVEKIETMLAAMACQLDPADIEVEGCDLDDVICKGGEQFDIKLDKDLNEVVVAVRVVAPADLSAHNEGLEIIMQKTWKGLRAKVPCSRSWALLQPDTQ